MSQKRRKALARHEEPFETANHNYQAQFTTAGPARKPPFEVMLGRVGANLPAQPTLKNLTHQVPAVAICWALPGRSRGVA